MKKLLLSLALMISLVPFVKQHHIDGRIITVCHNNVVDIMPMSSRTTTTLYDYGSSKTLVVNNNIIFSNVKDYSVE